MEASFWAKKVGREQVEAEHVQKTLEEKAYRSRLIEDKIQEMMEKGTILIEVSGKQVGQINGLSVLSVGGYAFGRPHRITARVYIGKEGVINIEREIALSGPIHSKGILTLAGYLGGTYAQDFPLTLSASLTFEQSYEGVEGDSASSAELYALLSALAELPISQEIAVTGSVNQYGGIQPIGGVNEKVEGHYAVCKAKGLTGGQGVMIPAQNIENLVLKDEVVQAVAKGKFHLWAVRSIDQGIELLGGVPAGKRDENGQFTPDSVHARVYGRLRYFARQMKEFTGHSAL
jgi:predicted ATP-dependent protease